ncbi:MAG: hypothetical protein DU481_07670 [Nitrosomonas sp.]|uniref:hypothetical protein n=1 Tax=Nitrosomonas sp. TaxID=42353 RepID=UPI0032EB409F
MSNLTMTAAKAAHAELLTRRGKFDQKKRDCESLVASITSKLSGLEQAHSILEKRYLSDEANLAQVTASRNEIEAKRLELSEAERLASLAAEAIREIDQQILQAELATAAAQREFCAEQRNASIAKIKADKTLRQNLLAAMVANTGAGGQFTYQAATFFSTFIHQLLPEISETEAREAVEKFRLDNGLG